MAKVKRLTKKHFEEMRGIAEGADIWGCSNARLCREIQQFNPDLIDIVPAMATPPGECQQPYFGAILTDYGRVVLKLHDAQPGEVEVTTRTRRTTCTRK